MAAPPASFAPSTSAPSSSVGGVTFDAIMAEFQRMDARLDTFSDELCLVNTRASRIARRQAHLGGFVESPSPTPKAFEDKDNNGDFNDDANEDEEATSSSDDEMTA